MEKEIKSRSIFKGITWRITASLCTMILVFIFTGNFTVMMEVGAVEVIAKFTLYYLHERVWNGIKWGRHEQSKKPTIS